MRVGTLNKIINTMPFKIKFSSLPAGFSTQAIKGPGLVRICTREFLSSEDGDTLVARLEAISELLFPLITPRTVIRPSCIDHLLTIIRPNSTGIIYINELDIHAEIQAKKDLKKGQAVFLDDIADVRRISFFHNKSPIEIPRDAGIIVLMSSAWRKGLFYDLSPLPPGKGNPRDYDIEVFLGQCHAYLAFQSRLKLSATEFEGLIQQKWFPFIALKRKTIAEMVNCIRNDWSIDDLLGKIREEVTERIKSRHNNWTNNPFFQPHVTIIETAAERYLNGDFISAVSILFPRIEGILRTYHILTHPEQNITQTKLLDSALDDNPKIQHARCLLLPNRFREYLAEVFFESFDPQDPQGFSRHTIAHGVTPATNFNEKAATLGFLILDQLSYCLAC